jgi:hypothetical protein
MVSPARVSTGNTSLDKVLDQLRIGDNVVWKVDSIDDYRRLVDSFVKKALEDKRRVVYMRFAQHDPLLEKSEEIKCYKLDPRAGFETFAASIYNIITEEGKEIFYVFDSLSDLLLAWTTDFMVGNFFWITCPYLYELDTVAYFALIRNHHSFKTIDRIRKTTQVLVNVFNYNDEMYIQPQKAWERYSPTMFLPHHLKDGDYVPVNNSYEATRLLSAIVPSEENSTRHIDHWHQLFLQAEEMAAGDTSAEEKHKMVVHICRHMIGREERILDLAYRYFSLEDLLHIKSRVVGTGYIGGKAVGMLLANNILLKDEGSTGANTSSRMIRSTSAPMFTIPTLCITGGGNCSWNRRNRKPITMPGRSCRKICLRDISPNRFATACAGCLTISGNIPL